MSDTVATLDVTGLPTAKIKRSDLYWFGLAAYVAAYDYHAIKTGRETLSRGYWRALSNPRTRWPAILVCTGLYKHLVFPKVLPKADPLYWVAERWHKGAPAHEYSN